MAAGADYLDVSAEQPAVEALYDLLDGPARDAGVSVVPATAFYGGAADLMTTAALDRSGLVADVGTDVTVAVGLDHWWPTAGTRLTGERNTSVRRVVRGGALVPVSDPAPTTTWTFPGALGDQPVVELPFSEVITVHRHLPVGRLTSYLATAPLDEIRDETTPAPHAVDDSGRSSQRFVVDVVVRHAGATSRVTVSGRRHLRGHGADRRGGRGASARRPPRRSRGARSRLRVRRGRRPRRAGRPPGR